jgi:hypothetical protein
MTIRERTHGKQSRVSRDPIPLFFLSYYSKTLPVLEDTGEATEVKLTMKTTNDGVLVRTPKERERREIGNEDQQ